MAAVGHIGSYYCQADVINNIGDRYERKNRELNELDEKMNSLNEIPHKNICTL